MKKQELSGRLRGLIVQAGRFARELGHSYVGTEHLLLALTLASLLIGCGVSKPVYFLFTACFAGGYALVYLALWRCPFCGERLGRSDGETCPHCGKSLLAPRGNQT